MLAAPSEDPFQTASDSLQGGGPPRLPGSGRLPEWLSAGRQADGRQGRQACPAGRPYGMPEGAVIG